MGKFLSDMISLGIEGLAAYSSAKKKAEEAKSVLEKLTSGYDEVPIEVFLKMYDLRIHDFESKQDDIKFMKNWDFEGVYIIHNQSKEAYHVGRSSKILRKIDRTFRGYENQDVYADWKRNDDFSVRVVRFEGSGYSEVTVLESDLRKRYGTYPRADDKPENKVNKKGFWARLFG